MEQQFQTSFIPKKPLVAEQTVEVHSSGIFKLISVIIFITTLVAGAGVYVYKAYLVKRIAVQDTSLNSARDDFEPKLIAELQRLEKRLNISQEIVSSHIAISPIFEALQEATLRSVRYNKFSYTLNPDSTTDKVVVKLTGQAQTYTAIALQSDALAKNKNIKNIIFSNLTLDDKGNVSFELTFSVNPELVSYKTTVQKKQATDVFDSTSLVPVDITPTEITNQAATTTTTPVPAVTTNPKTP